MPLPTAAPARILGAIDPLRYAGAVVPGAVSAGQRTTNGALLQAAFTAAASQEKYLEIDPVRVEYDCQTTDGGVNVGLYLAASRAGIIGAGMTDQTELIQYAADHPSLTLGEAGAGTDSYSAVFRDFMVGRGVTGTANSRGLLLGKHFYSTFQRINVSKENGLGTIFHPAVGVSHRTGGSLFSAVFDTFGVACGQSTCWDYQPGGGTGNHVRNCYVGGGGSEGARTILTAEALVIKDGHGTIFDQLNVEWLECAGIKIENNPGVVIDGLHFEGVRCIAATFDPSFLRVYGLGEVVINGMRLFECSTLAADRTGNHHLISVGGDASVEVNGLFIKPKVGAVYGGKDTLLRLVKADSAIWEANRVVIKQATGGGSNYPGTGGLDADASLPFGTYGQMKSVQEYSYELGRSTTIGAVFDSLAADFTLWAAHRKAKLRFNSAAIRKAILKDFVGASGSGATAPRPVGDTVEIHNGGTADVQVRNAGDTATLFTLTAGTAGKYVWSGSAWSAY